MLPTPEPPPTHRFDIRLYFALLVFRWRLVVLVFLFCMAGTALYIHYVPRVYAANAVLMVSRDPNLALGGRAHTPLQQFGAHGFMLRQDAMKERAARRAAAELGDDAPSWIDTRLPEVRVGRGGLASSLNVTARGADRDYLTAFLSALLFEHEREWRALQTDASENAVTILEQELADLAVKIARAEDELIEYQRLHDIARVEATGRYESSQLMTLIHRRGQLGTEIMLLEAQYPFLQEADAGVIEQIDRITRETTRMLTLDPALMAEDGDADGDVTRLHPRVRSREGEVDEDGVESMRVWQDLRVLLARVQEEEQDLSQRFTAEHPRLQQVREQIRNTRDRLETMTRIRMQQLFDRRKAMEIQIEALEGAEQDWQSRNLLASRRRSELNRIAAVVRRFEANYNTLYARLNDLRVAQELNAETFRIVQPVHSEEKPVWPDVRKLMIMALVLGLGGGVGLAIGLSFFDNKVQTPGDIEVDLNQKFLGGVPFWAHSRLDAAVRPIVIEEGAASAVESYRNLRSSLLAALEIIGEKILLVTSADSREGKTLTTLNVAILTAKMGKKVLLMDMDLRRGNLHRSLNISRSPGINDVLRNRGRLADVIVPTAIENLDFAPAGKHAPNIAELLQGIGLRDLMGDVAERYDYVFIDTTPLLRASEALILCNDGTAAVVMIVRVGRTPKALIRYALNMISRGRIIGLVVNNITLHYFSSLYYAYQYPGASYSYYEYGHYGEFTVKRPFGRFRRRIRNRLLQRAPDGHAQAEGAMDADYPPSDAPPNRS